MHDAARFALDGDNLRVEFRASLGPLPVHGIFRRAHGVLAVPDSDIERASVEVEVEAASLDTGLAMRDRHLRGPSFLHVARFPLITFASRKVTRDNGDPVVAGVLTLCGISRDIVTRCPIRRLEGEGVGGTIGVSGSLDIPLREHDIGVPRGIDILNPIFLVVGSRVAIDVHLTIPATRLLPALLPALGR